MITSERVNELMLEAQKSVNFLSNGNKSKSMLILNRFNELYNEEVSKQTLTDNDDDGVTVEKQIDEIIDSFNYAKVHSYMIDTNWTWAGANGVPDIGLMQNTNRGCLKLVYDAAIKKLANKPNEESANANMGTGGFEYECYVYRDTPKPYFSMKFVIADSFNEDW
jgi:hypothetical protein